MSAANGRADPAQYDAWYRTPRGEWIGETEYRLLADALGALPGDTVLDVGCGTGHFTRLFAERARVRAVGLDPDRDWVRYARTRRRLSESYVAGRAEQLPFPNQSFDHTIAVASLCFVADQDAALREMVRVTRKRLALGLLNRSSLLYLQKGRGGGVGAYRGAHWHTAAEIRAKLARLPIREVRTVSGIYLPSASTSARWLEERVPAAVLLGGFLLAAGTVAHSAERRSFAPER